MNWDNWVRQIHRWFSIAFTVAAIANIVVNIAGLQGAPAIWVGVSALPPLAAAGARPVPAASAVTVTTALTSRPPDGR